MLRKDPEQRITSSEAIKHPCFARVLSHSPLISRVSFNPKDLKDHQKKTHDLRKIRFNQSKKSMPNKIEDMSPLPRTPYKLKKKKNNYFKIENILKQKSSD